MAVGPQGSIVCKNVGEVELLKPKRMRQVCDYSAFLMHHPFDLGMDSQHPCETRTYVYRQFLGGLNWVPSSTRTNKAVQAWQAELAKSDSSGSGDGPQATSTPLAAA